MFVVRPPGIRTTPGAIAHDLGCQTRFYPNRSRRRLFDYRRDFFMTAVRPEDVRNAPPNYADLFNFLGRDKYAQRKALAASGIPTPRVAGSHTQSRDEFGAGGRFVVRPLRHSGGRGYRVTENPLDFQPGVEYISELYPKKREYRVIFVFGNPLISLRKKPNGQTTQEEPWGHINSTFQTINNTAGSKLAQTDFYWRLAHCQYIRTAHILAVDVLYNQGRENDPYVVLEYNACPGLTIDANREKIVEAIHERMAGN